MNHDPMRIRLIAYVAIGVAGLALAISGFAIDFGMARVALGVVSSVPLVVSVYDRFLWHRRWTPKGPPDLRGAWKATLTSTYVDPGTNQSSGCIDAYVVIRQTAMTLSATLLTGQSMSHSVVAAVHTTTDGRFEVSWMYRNEAAHAYRKGSPIHYGGARLHPFTGRRPGRLEGEYFTDRGTSGDLMLVDRRSSYPDTYAEAIKTFE